MNKLWNILEQQKGKRKLLKEQYVSLKKAYKNLSDYLESLEQAREIVKEVGLKTQQSLQFHISDITTLALTAVFDDPYELKVNFVQRRNKMECDLFFNRNGQDIDPLESSGYGAVDVASFALRIASLSLMNPKIRPVIILDEPMRFLSQDRQTYASKMIKEISERLGIQFIIVTHEETLTEYADRVFSVSLNKIGEYKKSKIIES